MGHLHLPVLLLLSILVIGTTVSADTSEVNPSSVTFNKSEKFLQTSKYVYHIALDLYKNDGSILFGTHQNLNTTDGETTSTLVTISNSWVTGFTQVNSTHVVLVARDSQHCIKILNRQNNQLQTLAGTCGSRGHVEGEVGIGKLDYPWGVEVDVRNPGKLLVTDYRNHALRSVDLHTGELDTVVRSGLQYPFGMLWVNNKLLVTNQHYISEVNWLNNGTVTNTIIAGSTTSSGYVVGSFSESRFYTPHGLIEVGEGLILVADEHNGKLRLLNMNTGIVGPVCTDGVFPCTSGTHLQSRPQTLLKSNTEVYVGTSKGIYKFSGSDLPVQARCPYSNITVYVGPDQETGDVRLHCGNTAVLPRGVYQFKREHNSYTCHYYIHVVDSPVIRTLVFKAEYETSCSSVSDNNTQALLQSVLLQRKNQFQPICIEDCTMSSIKQPWFVCDENLLTVYWPTAKVYSVDVVTPPPGLTAQLKERLQQKPDMCTEMVISSQIPPLVEAKKNSEGEPVQIALFSSCSNSNLAYNADQDICV